MESPQSYRFDGFIKICINRAWEVITGTKLVHDQSLEPEKYRNLGACHGGHTCKDARIVLPKKKIQCMRFVPLHRTLLPACVEGSIQKVHK